jgi:glycosyltransferase involved in cell wall biosynthesis
MITHRKEFLMCKITRPNVGEIVTVQSTLSNNMKENPLVSIVVPVYNTEKYLAKCLDSLINQTYTNIEIVVVNDGSTDSSPQIIQQYAENDARIKVIDKPNGGLASARNAGVAIATGEYIWNVDSDDYAELDGLEVMVDVANRDCSDVVVSAHKIIPNDEMPEESFYRGPGFNTIISDIEALCLLLFTNIGGDVWCKLYKKSLYVDNKIVQKEEFSACEDVLLNYQLYSKAKCISPVEHITINHFFRANSLSSQAKAKRKSFWVSHHLGLRYMANYGFPTEDIKNAYSGYLGSDFLRCFKCRNIEVLKAIDVTSIKDFYRYLGYIACYRKVKDKNVKLSFKRKYVFGIFGIKAIRLLGACFFKLLSLSFKSKNN